MMIEFVSSMGRVGAGFKGKIQLRRERKMTKEVERTI
jgi:hypothetical protein